MHVTNATSLPAVLCSLINSHRIGTEIVLIALACKWCVGNRERCTPKSLTLVLLLMCARLIGRVRVVEYVSYAK